MWGVPADPLASIEEGGPAEVPLPAIGVLELVNDRDAASPTDLCEGGLAALRREKGARVPDSEKLGGGYANEPMGGEDS